jgi:hypothetical protein
MGPGWPLTRESFPELPALGFGKIGNTKSDPIVHTSVTENARMPTDQSTKRAGQALPKPAGFSDGRWQEKISLAKLVRADRQKDRAGKSPVFATRRRVSLPKD